LSVVEVTASGFPARLPVLPSELRLIETHLSDIIARLLAGD